MKRVLKVIAFAIISVCVFEFVVQSAYKEYKHYKLVMYQNTILREELQKCKEKLDSLENRMEYDNKISFRGL